MSVKPADKAIRQFTLLMLLTASERPVSRFEIFERMPGFFPDGAQARERMFERDKDELRSLGVLIETVENMSEEDSIGYRIRYATGPTNSVRFTSEESTAVLLATGLWAHSDFAAAIQQTSAQVQAIGNAPNAMDIAESVHITPLPATVAPITQAIQSTQVITFNYRKSTDSTASTRTVEPWAVAARGGHWYVTGNDVQRQESRVFRLDRIVGDVSLASDPGAFIPPAELDVEHLITVDEQSTPTPRLRLRKNTCWRLRRIATTTVAIDSDWDECTLRDSNERRLARAIAEHAPDALPMSPGSLASAVRSILTADPATGAS